MNNNEFKMIFNEVAQACNYKKAFGGWYKESQECIAVLELQKSSFANVYYLNVKIFIREIFDRVYVVNKDLIKSSMGHITNQIRDKEVLDMDDLMNNDKRKEELILLFVDEIIPFVNKAMTLKDIVLGYEKSDFFLSPAIRKELGIA